MSLGHMRSPRKITAEEHKRPICESHPFFCFSPLLCAPLPAPHGPATLALPRLAKPCTTPTRSYLASAVRWLPGPAPQHASAASPPALVVPRPAARVGPVSPHPAVCAGRPPCPGRAPPGPAQQCASAARPGPALCRPREPAAWSGPALPHPCPTPALPHPAARANLPARPHPPAPRPAQPIASVARPRQRLLLQ
jgi:hypothetical protein